MNARRQPRWVPGVATLLLSAVMGVAVGAEEDQQTAAMPSGSKLYGWIQQGFTANPDDPSDRINFGANFNWRSNDYRLNQVYLVYENVLEHEDHRNVGYRLDGLVGHDAPFFAANGLFSGFTGLDPTSGIGADGPGSFRDVNRIGIDLPQFYLEAHLPHWITKRGMDFRVGKIYTWMGREVYPAPATDFYSRSYENVLGTPFTHTCVMATLHATDTLDVVAGVVRGWDVFKDNNGRPSYHGAVIWNSTSKRYNWTTAWISGPEQPDNDNDYRSLLSSYVTVKFGQGEKWMLSTGGHYGYESNAALDAATGGRKAADWYAYSSHLFYTIDSRLKLGLRGEWFRDDEGTRTGVLKRPGFAASFYDVTVGATYKPRPHVWIRPEIRFDWSPEARAFNDQTAKSQFTGAFDVVWELPRLEH